MKNRGFTLVEIMVVVAFIGLLATIMIVSYQSTMKKSRDNRRVADALSIKQAANMYADKTEAYPSTGGNNVCSSTGVGLGHCDPGECPGGASITSWSALTDVLIDFANLKEFKDPQIGSEDRCFRYRSNGNNCTITYYSELIGGDITTTCK